MLPDPHELVRKITDLQRETVARWHTSEPDNCYDGLLATICRQHQFNYLLWHEEDVARSPDVSDRRIAAVKDGDAVVGSRTKVKIVKNKVAAPFRDAEFDILYGEGISREGDVLDLAVANNVVEKSGAWFSYSGERIGQGRENVRQYLKDNRDTFDRIHQQLRQKLGIAGVKEAEVPPVPVNGAAVAEAAVRPVSRRPQ